MSKWIKIKSFSNAYEAEIRKQLLQNAQIQSVVLNARDSLFLFGNVDLYVNEEDEKRALNILEQFQGLTKINSFILKKPVELFQNVLEDNGFETVLKQIDDEKFILDNYELYVKNEDAAKVVPFLTGEKLTDWTKIDTSEKVRQTRYKIELLADNNIEALIIKKKDTDFHLEEINIYVKNSDKEKAANLLENLDGWTKIKTYEKREVAELRTDVLAKHRVRAIMKNVADGKIELFVKNDKKEIALDVVNATKEWVEVRRYSVFTDADNMQDMLHQEDIDASVLAIKDNVFLLGGFALYVEKNKLNEAIEIITNIEGGKIIE